MCGTAWRSRWPRRAGLTLRDDRPVSWDEVLLSRLARPVIGRFSGFELIREIGRGAQGIVFLARTREGDPVALKVLRSDGTPRDRARLVREAAVLRDLDHPAVPKVREFIDDGRGVALVTDHVDGVPLDSWARGKSARDLARSALRAAEALRVVHDAGVLHHDIKPGHLLVDPAGNVHLLDFGAARARDTVRPSTFVGTLAYAAPERLRASVDASGSGGRPLLARGQSVRGRHGGSPAECRVEGDRLGEREWGSALPPPWSAGRSSRSGLGVHRGAPARGTPGGSVSKRNRSWRRICGGSWPAEPRVLIPRTIGFESGR